MCRNVAIKGNSSCGGTHFIIPWLSPLYVSNFHRFLHTFLGRIRSSLSLLRADSGEFRSKGAVCAGWSWHDSPAVPMGRGSESDALTNALQAQRWGVGWSRSQPHCRICSLFNEQLAPGGTLGRDMPIRRYLLPFCQFAFTFSRVLQQGALGNNRIYHSVGNLLLLPLLLPPLDVLICSLRGHRQL